MNAKQIATIEALNLFAGYRSDIHEVKQTNTLTNGRPIIKVRFQGEGPSRYEVFFELNEKGEPVKANGYEYIGCVLDMPFKEATEQARALCTLAHLLVAELETEAADDSDDEAEPGQAPGLPFTRDDGGRVAAGYKGQTGDCVVRAIAIASGRDYGDVYRDLFEANKTFIETHRGKKTRKGRIAAKIAKKNGTPRDGNFKHVYHDYILGLGFDWVCTMHIGQGCTVHMREGELPNRGRIIARVSKHLAAVVDGELRDTYDCTRGGSRCVYGYYIQRDEA